VNELQSVCHAAAELARLSEPALLATVVQVEGSTYRRPGARMLVTPAGRRVGCVSGGCLEADIARRGWQLTESGQPALITYDSTADEDVQWGLGLGCNGVVRVLIERLAPGPSDHATPPAPLAVSRPGSQEHLSILDTLTHARTACAVALVFSSEDTAATPGTRLILDENGNLLLDQLPAALSEEVRTAAHTCLATTQSANYTLRTPAGRVDLFVEYIEPPPSLLIVGAGFDAVPLAAAAAAAGWRVTVADPRARYATPEHFPTADDIVVCPADQLPRHTTIDGRTFAVIMNHHYPDDLAALAALLLDTPARYVGLLGPSHRREKLLHDLAEQGHRPTPAQLARLYGPVGLDLAAETPAEVAAAILAEILAVRAARPAGFLRDLQGPIHDTPNRQAASLAPRALVTTPSPAGG
jgi:xanthine/CO dehydrogenase XdhC/CoxF family maturation factor